MLPHSNTFCNAIITKIKIENHVTLGGGERYVRGNGFKGLCDLREYRIPDLATLGALPDLFMEGFLKSDVDCCVFCEVQVGI